MAPSKSVPVLSSCSNMSSVASPIDSRNNDRCWSSSVMLSGRLSSGYSWTSWHILWSARRPFQDHFERRIRKIVCIQCWTPFHLYLVANLMSLSLLLYFTFIRCLIDTLYVYLNNRRYVLYEHLACLLSTYHVTHKVTHEVTPLHSGQKQITPIISLLYEVIYYQP